MNAELSEFVNFFKDSWHWWYIEDLFRVDYFYGSQYFLLFDRLNWIECRGRLKKEVKK